MKIIRAGCLVRNEEMGKCIHSSSVENNEGRKPRWRHGLGERVILKLILNGEAEIGLDL